MRIRMACQGRRLRWRTVSRINVRKDMPKKLSLEVRRRLKEILQREMPPRFPQHGSRWQSAAAEALGVDQSTVSRMLQEPPQGGSPDFAEKVAEYLNEDPGEILYGTAPKDQVPRLREMKGYDDAHRRALAKIEEEKRAIPPWALEKAGDFRSRPPVPIVTAGLLVELAATFARDEKWVERHRLKLTEKVTR